MYVTISFMPQVVSSMKALLVHKGKYLFLRETLHKGDIWDLPGGKIEYGEEPLHALAREVKEEIDIDIKILHSVGVWWFYSLNSKHQVICHTFLCEPIGEVSIDTTKNPADEHFVEYRWLTRDEVLKSEIKITESLRNLLINLD